MNPNMEWIAPLLGVTFVGSMFLMGLRMWLHRPRLPKDLPDGEVSGLIETVEQLQEHVLQLRGEMSDLHERMDFAERLLTKGKD
jgi:hypothetical protein